MTPRRRKDGPGQLSFVDWADRLTARAEAEDLSALTRRLFAVVAALLAIGFLVQTSYHATVLEPLEFRNELVEQLLFRIAAVSALVAGLAIGPRGLRRLLPLLVVACALLLVACFLPGLGVEKNGSNRWVSLGVVFQPSELARIVVVLWIADRCVRLGPRVYDLKRGIAPMLGLVLFFFALILAETDLGGALLLFICAASTMWVGGARPLHMTISLVAIGGGAFSAMTVAIPYVRQRVSMFLGKVDNDQVSDTLVALASGGPFGRGIGQGSARLAGVPYLQSDYVFAQIGEELGLAGMLLVLLLLLALLWFGLRLVLSIRDRFSALAAFGLCLSVGLQAMLHVQVVAGLAPPKGMTLPFVSDGGTSLVVSSLAVGLVLGAARRERPEPTPCLPSNATA